jgi:hypothetical protein
MEKIRERFGEDWRAEWVRFRGLGAWADYYRRIAAEFEGDKK